MKPWKLFYLSLLLAPLPLQAAPELNVGGLYDYLDGDRSTLLKRVRNGGDSTAFVKVSVAELVYDANSVPREIDQTQLPLEQRGLIASPARLIIPARGMQAVRLLYRGERAQERYFRLRFIPVLPEQGDGFAVTEAEAESYRDSLKAGVNLLAGYGTLLFVHPAAAQYQTDVTGQGGRLQVVNQGNATVVLDHFRQCQAADQKCEAATKHHLLPGSTRRFEPVAGKPVFQFEMYEGDQRKTLVVSG